MFNFMRDLNEIAEENDITEKCVEENGNAILNCDITDDGIRNVSKPKDAMQILNVNLCYLLNSFICK